MSLIATIIIVPSSVGSRLTRTSAGKLLPSRRSPAASISWPGGRERRSVKYCLVYRARSSRYFAGTSICEWLPTSSCAG